MLAETVKEWTQKWKEEGIEAGRQEGWQEGRQEGRQEGIQAGRQEGIQKGIEKGEWIGKIEMLEHFLGYEVTDKAEYGERSVEWLEKKFHRLEKEYAKKFRK